MDQDCATNGLPGDGKTYRPPNGLDAEIQALLAKNKADYFGNVAVRLNLAKPPGDSEVQKELLALADMQESERPQAMGDIDAERYHFHQVFERVLHIENVGNPEKRATRQLLIALGSVVGFWVAREKERFNRPRPVQLRPGLKPPFCPGHPAYPSSHASEAHTSSLALIEATDKYPQLHGPLAAAAADIARHREIAGVHYPSDSKCGAELAKQLTGALRADPEKLYEQLVARVRAELDAIYGRQGAPKPTPSASRIS